MLSEEAILADTEQMPGVVVTGFEKGWPICRYYFSRRLPFPNVARSFLFLPDDPSSGSTVIEWWSHPSPESLARDTRNNQVMRESRKWRIPLSEAPR